jgi:hypothetical protein
MFSDTAINLLLQIPLAGVVVFVVMTFLKYLEKSETRFVNFLSEQRQADREVLTSLTNEIQKMTEMQETHDKRMSSAVARMEERTRPRPKAASTGSE